MLEVTIMNEPAVSRRDFLRNAGIGTAGMAGAALIPSLPTTCEADENRPKPACWTPLSEHLSVYHGPINVGLLRDDRSGKVLLIDCGDGRVIEHFEKLGVTAVDRVVFTHHHRDQACGAWALKQRGAKIGVPAGERDLFDKVAAYWGNPSSRWHLYNFHPHHLTLWPNRWRSTTFTWTGRRWIGGRPGFARSQRPATPTARSVTRSK